MIHLGNAPSGAVLRAHADRWQGLSLATIIDSDPEVRAAMAVEAAGLTLDFSRQRLDQGVLDALIGLARDCGVPSGIHALFDGHELNVSERRAAWHTALRAHEPPSAVADLVLAERERLQQFVNAVHRGDIANADGECFTDVINIGVGGSDLGPRLVVDALARVGSPLKAHFLGNLDSAALQRTLDGIDPRRCLCVTVSKSFTTAETVETSAYVRRWLEMEGVDVALHCVAVTANTDLALQQGLAPERVFAMWDWVGGRFSLWSSVGLVAALALGWERFAALLRGAAAMDAHFHGAPLERNLPVIWALLGLWNRNFLGYDTQVTAVYSEKLAQLPAWLQQLDMESNGKAVSRHGESLDHACGTIQWGGVGTSVQHAFFQLLHQGREAHPVDFVLPVKAPDVKVDTQRELLANALAQAAALSHGRSLDDRADLSDIERAWRQCPGGRPSSLIWLDELNEERLGALLAAYEHRCFIQGWIWGVNSFDQFGVELGKVLARGILSGLDGDESAWPDALSVHQARHLQPLAD